MSFYDVSGQAEATNARPGILHLLRNHRPGQGPPTALLEVVDAYLRLNPGDAEVRDARDGMREYDPGVGG